MVSTRSVGAVTSARSAKPKFGCEELAHSLGCEVLSDEMDEFEIGDVESDVDLLVEFDDALFVEAEMDD